MNSLKEQDAIGLHGEQIVGLGSDYKIVPPAVRGEGKLSLRQTKGLPYAALDRVPRDSRSDPSADREPQTVLAVFGRTRPDDERSPGFFEPCVIDRPKLARVAEPMPRSEWGKKCHPVIVQPDILRRLRPDCPTVARPRKAGKSQLQQ